MFLYPQGRADGEAGLAMIGGVGSDRDGGAARRLALPPRSRRAEGELARQASIARALGSPFVGAVLEAGERQIGRAPLTAALIAGWPGDPAAAALAMRFNAALHALARRGRPATLGALYAGEHEDYDHAIGEALAAEDAFIAAWMRYPTQTNEVGRAAAILSALMVAGARYGLPVEVMELGSSSGLNLNLAHYSYRLGPLATGVAASPVRIAPTWRGAAPPATEVRILSARGVDLQPLDPADAATRERLLSYVWADQPERRRRLEAALAVARDHPPAIDRADAASWLAARLGEPQAAGTCRAVFHSMVLQYLSRADRAGVVAALSQAGERATADRPLAWISFEWTPDRSEVHLTLTCWPGGDTRLLARCHPYGDWVDWQAPPAA